jgi:hypothetical protein
MSLPTVSRLLNGKSLQNELMNDEVIRLENVSVQYRVPYEQIGTFRE